MSTTRRAFLKLAAMAALGVGGGASLSAATMRLETFAGFTFEQLAMKIDRD